MSDQLSLLQKRFDTALESPDGIKKLRELFSTILKKSRKGMISHRKIDYTVDHGSE